MPSNSNTPSLLKSISPVPFKNRSSGGDVDPKWKQFASAVDRALANWENVQEWADYISFLGKFHRALKQASGQQFSKIPSANLVAFRLARCLDPSLPSGVHQKTLEVYNSVFEILNGQELHYQIHLWLPGLLPLMSYASINIKPPLIALFEHHILPLPSLRSILKPLLLSFLPGIDDESSESFDEVFKLIEDIKLKVNDDSHFWQCLFLVMISSRDRRPGALVWANKKFPSFAAISNSINIDDLISDIPAAYQALSYDAQMAATPETGLLIRAFSKGLQDDHSLVQRGFLELLVKNLELQSPVLQIIASKDDLQLLLVSACSTVLRRDMSLNRRLWIWLLGPEPISNDSSSSTPHYSRAEYFAKFALEPLSKGLLEMINSDPVIPSERTRAYKICLSILDRWEIGSSVVPRVLLPIIRSVQRYDNIKRSESDYEEVIRSAGALFDGVEAINIWSDVLKLILEGGHENMELVLFILEVFNVRDEEMIVNHLPMILLALLYEGEKSRLWFKVCFSILDFIPERAFLPIHHADSIQDITAPLDKIKEYYELTSDDDSAILPFTPATLSLLLLNQLADLTQKSLDIIQLNSTDQSIVGNLATLLSNLLGKIPEQKLWRNHGLVNALIKLEEPIIYSALSGIVTLFITIYESFNDNEVDDFLFSISRFLFSQLSITSNNHQVEIVQLIWALQEKLDDQRIESALATLFTDPKYNSYVKIRVFSTLWQHSINRANSEVVLERCLFLVLDLLFDSSDSATLVQHWLQCVIVGGTSRKLLQFIVHPLIYDDVTVNGTSSNQTKNDDNRLSIYYLNTLVKTLQEKPALQIIYFNEEISPGKTISGAVMDTIENIMYQSADQNSAEIQEAINSSLDLLELSDSEQENDLLQLAMLLLSVLGFYYGSKDLTSLPQVRILKLLSKTLLRLDEISPIWKQIYSNDLFGADQADKTDGTKKSLPKTLFQCLVNGLSTSKNEYVGRAWADFLIDILPVFGQGVIQVIIPLVECLCKAIGTNFEETRKSLLEDNKEKGITADTLVLYPFMDALEYLLITAHEKLDSQDSRSTSTKNAADPSFFGNVISGVFAVESPISRPAAANDRLTILLCFQDAVRANYNIWKWVEQICRPAQNPTDSVVFILSPLKSRTRKLLTKLYSLETLEMLECYIERSKSSGGDVFKVLHVLDGSRPKLTIPYLFNALISRINPSSLEASEKSTLTTDLEDIEIADFLVNYLHSLENDTIEEVWYECMSFVREVYNSQSLYRHILPSILKFVSAMAEKVESVKFGEQRKVRKDLSDLFLKLLHYTLNTRSSVGTDTAVGSFAVTPSIFNEKDSEISLPQEASNPSTPIMSNSATSLPLGSTATASSYSQSAGGVLKQEDLAMALEQIVPSLRIIINDNDKTLTAISNITTSLISPALRQKNYTSIPSSLISLLNIITQVPLSLKSWKGIVGDAFLDPRFLAITESQAAVQWKPIISKWCQFDKERIKDYVSRISSFGTNSNVLFGWSDQESAIQSQNLDRLAYLFICGNGDGFAISFKDLMDKFELLCVGRNVRHVFICLRSIILSVDPTHLAPVWTFLYSRLSSTFRDFLNQESTIDFETLVAACKLLDTTLILNPEDFQPYEWLFICDSMDAIFRNEDRDPSGIVDRIAASKILPSAQSKFDINFTDGAVPLLNGKSIKSLTDLRPFFDQLSMFAYEGLYSLAKPDIADCKREVLRELFQK